MANAVTSAIWKRTFKQLVDGLNLKELVQTYIDVIETLHICFESNFTVYQDTYTCLPVYILSYLIISYRILSYPTGKAANPISEFTLAVRRIATRKPFKCLSFFHFQF